MFFPVGRSAAGLGSQYGKSWVRHSFVFAGLIITRLARLARREIEERALLERFIDAHERGDAEAAVSIAAQDIRITMPPYPYSFEGLEAVATLMERAFGEEKEGDWRLVPAQANRMPAAASYLRRPGDSEFRAFKLDVLRIEDGLIAEITTFGYVLFPAFGLPPTL